jgi:hypothetical protein
MAHSPEIGEFQLSRRRFCGGSKKKRRRFVVVMVSNSRSASSSAQSHATEAEANQCIINPNHVPETREAI